MFLFVKVMTAMVFNNKKHHKNYRVLTKYPNKSTLYRMSHKNSFEWFRGRMSEKVCTMYSHLFSPTTTDLCHSSPQLQGTSMLDLCHGQADDASFLVESMT